MSQKAAKFLDLKLNSSDRDSLLKELVLRLEKVQKTVIVTPNPEIILKARIDKDLLKALQSANVALADGIGLVWALRFLAGKKVPRVAGRQFAEDLLQLANDKRLKVYLLGASKIVNAKAQDKIKSQYKNLKIEGRSGPRLDQKAKPVTLRDRESYYDTLKHIKAFNPDILLVAFGAPKQELWILDNKKKLNAKIIMAVGGTLDYISGKMKLPPAMFSKLGLEWLWRLGQDPARIFRIFNAVVIFPLYILGLKLSKANK